MKVNSWFLLIPIFLIVSCTQEKQNTKSESQQSPKDNGLPILGHREFENGDTVYHTIPDFIFLNQDSVFIKSEDLEGKIIVANFFFTTCPSICPTMTKQMKRLQGILEADSNLVVFLSHTIDAETDVPSRLKAFGEHYEVNFHNWHFLYGEMEYLFEIAKEGYLSTALEDEQEPGGFLHSQYFILVDKERRIRGMYDGTLPNEVDKLAKDFGILKKEYANK